MSNMDDSLIFIIKNIELNMFLSIDHSSNKINLEHTRDSI